MSSHKEEKTVAGVVVCEGNNRTIGFQDNFFKCVVTSPPYKTKDGYSTKDISDLFKRIESWLKPGGLAFMNFGQLKEDFSRPFELQQAIKNAAPKLTAMQTILWVKSLVVDGKQKGHYQPINSPHVLNYCHEYIFVFCKPLESGKLPVLDRLSIGVPYADASNLKRGSRGKNGNLHCGGDVWLIPHKNEDNLDEFNDRWLALFIDTASSIRVKMTRGRSGKITYYPMIEMESLSKEIMDRVRSMVGCGQVRTIHSQNKDGSRQRNFYELVIAGRQAYHLLARLYPYLIAKKRQARACLFLKSCQDHKEKADALKIIGIVSSLEDQGKAEDSWIPEPSFIQEAEHGSAWFIPYATTGQKEKKKHEYEFPQELAERCLKLAGCQPGDAVLDPFAGSGVVARAAKPMKLKTFLVEQNHELCEQLRAEFDETNGD